MTTAFVRIAHRTRPVGHPRRGFTIVELLVVIGIIGVLAGLLLPALAGARQRGYKAAELNRIRQIGAAWNMYSNSNDDACLPGFLAEDVQYGEPGSWKVRYKFKDKTSIDTEVAQSWVWRLMAYLDYNHDVVHGYLDEPDASDFSAIDEAENIALTPAFGYNAYYVGGWWDEWYEPPVDPGEPPVDPIAKPRYWQARSLEDPTVRLNVISRSPSTIRNSANLILFCSSSEFPSPREYHDVDRYLPGAAWVSAPILADERQWERTQADTVIGTLENDVAAPIGRYTDQAAVLNADGHTESEAPGSLDDMQRWTDAAASKNFKFSEN